MPRISAKAASAVLALLAVVAIAVRVACRDARERERETQRDRSESERVTRERGTQLSDEQASRVQPSPPFLSTPTVLRLTFSLLLLLSLLRLSSSSSSSPSSSSTKKHSSSSPSRRKPRRRSLLQLLLPPPITRAPSRSRPPTGPRPRSFREARLSRSCSCRTPRASSTTSPSGGTTRRDTR